MSPDVDIILYYDAKPITMFCLLFFFSVRKNHNSFFKATESSEAKKLKKKNVDRFPSTFVKIQSHNIISVQVYVSRLSLSTFSFRYRPLYQQEFTCSVEETSIQIR